MSSKRNPSLKPSTEGALSDENFKKILKFIEENQRKGKSLKFSIVAGHQSCDELESLKVILELNPEDMTLYEEPADNGTTDQSWREILKMMETLDDSGIKDMYEMSDLISHYKSHTGCLEDIYNSFVSKLLNGEYPSGDKKAASSSSFHEWKKEDPPFGTSSSLDYRRRSSISFLPDFNNNNNNNGGFDCVNNSNSYNCNSYNSNGYNSNMNAFCNSRTHNCNCEDCRNSNSSSNGNSLNNGRISFFENSNNNNNNNVSRSNFNSNSNCEDFGNSSNNYNGSGNSSNSSIYDTRHSSRLSSTFNRSFCDNTCNSSSSSSSSNYNSSRPRVHFQSFLENEGWECHHCTYCNVKFESQCEMCSIKRLVIPIGAQEHLQKIKAAKASVVKTLTCTYTDCCQENHDGTTICSDCKKAKVSTTSKK